MLKIFHLLFWIGIILTITSCYRSEVQKIGLTDNWQFKQADTGNWLPAKVPGCVHTDLMDNGIIDDPFFADNEQTLQWIGETDWEYKTFFNAEELKKYERIDLVFEGLDAYADVYLNDSLILTTDNMFREWTVDIKDLLNPERNDLYIRFYYPERIEKDKAAQINYKLPDERGFTRKAPYHYGWDWGPKFITMGVWQPVNLRAWNEARIENIQIIQNEIRDDTAFLTAVFEIESVKDQPAKLILTDVENQTIIKSEIQLSKGTKSYPVNFFILEPKLWWPNGLGDQHLYKLIFALETKNAKDQKTERIGLRTIKLVQEPDSIGSSFYFEVNGWPVFMKGANYIPQDNFLARVTDEKYQQTIQNAVDANMNMLRVWGGGIYEKDIFYDLCDENGILVWQDFMFACNMYPGDEPFIENVKQEAIQNVKRLRNNPCLALWCGNNEVDEGWFNWGWQKSLGYSEADSLEVWNSYLKIFEDVLPGIIKDYDRKMPYWPSSPKQGWGHEQALYSGDLHYWGVWWGEEPFEVYEKKVGRFMSEYGFQGFPNMRTLDSCLMPEDKHLKSPALLNHQKHPRGMQLIQTYMERDFKVPELFEHYAYVSQLMQGYGIRKALEAHRRAKPWCMGTLYWQLNDCWPVISWSSVDYYNRWKALHYFARETFKDFLISFEEKNDSLYVFIVSDKLQSVNAELDLRIISFDGDEFWLGKQVVDIPANSSSIYFVKEVIGFSKNDHLFSAKLISNNKILASNIYYFLPVKDLKLPKPNIQKEIIKTTDGYQIVLKTDKLARNVFLSVDGDGFFSDNYFDLMPGEGKRITYIPEQAIDSFESEIKVISIFDTLLPSRSR
ncbi:MAG: glycoside hydrolase family 2 protein [Bacteroidales bacterium]|nr:glycoside hydrolase family 2 protein [Bacteroidales bacterium]